MNIENFRKDASIQSLGSSNEEIYQTAIASIKSQFSHFLRPKILDVGCGMGHMFNPLKQIFPETSYTGTDISFFPHAEFTEEQFIQHDFNKNFDGPFENYDLIIALEVIEHLENPRHFMRQLSSLLKPKGKLIISTPNPESYTSLLSFFFRGFHSAFGPSNYPAHINAISVYEMNNIIREIDSLQVEQTRYIHNGRVPKSTLKWKNIMPMLRGKRVSDNYLLVATKV